jgi:hypothetical protein
MPESIFAGSPIELPPTPTQSLPETLDSRLGDALVSLAECHTLLDILAGVETKQPVESQKGTLGKSVQLLSIANDLRQRLGELYTTIGQL